MAVPLTGPRKASSGDEYFDWAHVEFQILPHFQVKLLSRQVNREPGVWRSVLWRHIDDGSHYILRI